MSIKVSELEFLLGKDVSGDDTMLIVDVDGGKRPTSFESEFFQPINPTNGPVSKQIKISELVKYTAEAIKYGTDLR